MGEARDYTIDLFDAVIDHEATIPMPDFVVLPAP
jgi:hypothetical protein